MTLPPGFGSRDQDKRRPTRTCILGKPCDRAERCKIHEWTYDHDEAWLLIKIILVVATLLVGLFTIVFVSLEYQDSVNEPIRKNIEGYNCNDLAEYIADQSKEYMYAKHRYTWLCVNEQIKEFQG